MHAHEGDYADARRTYETALTILRGAVAPTDPEIGRTLANLGVLDYYEGRFAESEARYRQALAILTPALSVAQQSDAALMMLRCDWKARRRGEERSRHS